MENFFLLMAPFSPCGGLLLGLPPPLLPYKTFYWRPCIYLMAGTSIPLDHLVLVTTVLLLHEHHPPPPPPHKLHPTLTPHKLHPTPTPHKLHPTPTPHKFHPTPPPHISSTPPPTPNKLHPHPTHTHTPLTHTLSLVAAFLKYVQYLWVI